MFLAVLWHALEHQVKATLQTDSHTDAFYNEKQAAKFIAICYQKVK